MIHHWKDTAAMYPALYKGKEYILYVRKDGGGVCAAEHDALSIIASTPEGRLSAILEGLASPRKNRQVARIEEEFTIDIQLPPKISRRIWLVWKLAEGEEIGGLKVRAKVKARIDRTCNWLDEALEPIFEAYFPDLEDAS